MAPAGRGGAVPGAGLRAPAPVTKPPAPVAKSPAPPAEKQEPTVGTTVSPVVTPTAGTDPRKRLYKTVYAQRPE